MPAKGGSMFNSQCSAENQPSAHFCHECDADLSGAPTQATASVWGQLFFSFDLVGATAFKESDNNWPSLLYLFHNKTSNFLADKGFHFWKSAGDEVLFYKVIKSDVAVLEAVWAAYNAMKEIEREIHKFQKEINSSRLLYLKGGASFAIIRRNNILNEGDIKTDNIGHPVKISTECTVFDFIGPDIDILFRILGKTYKGKMVLCAQLSYFIMLILNKLEKEDVNANDGSSAEILREVVKSFYQGEDLGVALNDPINYFKENIRIIGYSSLKGVWSGEAYPIVWFSDEWRNIEKSYTYLDNISKEKDSILPPGVRDGLLGILKDLKTSNLKDIERVVEHRNISYRIVSYYDLLASKPINEIIPFRPIQTHGIYCVALCYRTQADSLIKEIFCVEFNDFFLHLEQTLFKGKTGFGHCRLRLGQNFHDCISEGYKTDFNIKINKDSLALVGAYQYEVLKKVIHPYTDPDSSQNGLGHDEKLYFPVIVYKYELPSDQEMFIKHHSGYSRRYWRKICDIEANPNGYVFSPDILKGFIDTIKNT